MKKKGIKRLVFKQSRVWLSANIEIEELWIRVEFQGQIVTVTYHITAPADG